MGELNIFQAHQSAKILSSLNASDGRYSRLDRTVVGKDDNVTIGTKATQLRQVVVLFEKHVLQVDTNRVTDADTRSGIQFQLDGSTRSAVLNEAHLVKVARHLVGSDDTIHRSRIEHRTRRHVQDVLNRVNRPYRQVLDRWLRILFLA